MGSKLPQPPPTDGREAKPSAPPPLAPWPGRYWDRTDQVQAAGRVPRCCGEPMAACDDHGRFLCFGCGRMVSV